MPPLPTVHPAARRHTPKHPVTLLVWHDIVGAKKQVWFDTTRAEFEKQLQTLASAGAKPISLAHLYLYLRDGKPLPPPGAAVLCFDDNTVGIYDHAFPLLAKRGWPFVVSAHTAFIGVPTGKKHNTWEQLKEMRRGGAQIASQTHTHPPDLRALSPKALRADLLKSKALLELALEQPMPFLTYPSGKWSRPVAEAAQAVGYKLALTEDHGPAESSPHLLAINRYSTHRRFPKALRAIEESGGV